MVRYERGTFEPFAFGEPIVLITSLPRLTRVVSKQASTGRGGGGSIRSTLHEPFVLFLLALISQEEDVRSEIEE